MLKRLPPILRNFYALVTAGFIVWMVFFDINDLINQYFSLKKLHELEEEKDFYLQKTDEVTKEREEVLSKPHLLEKYAREKYLMKKKTEEVYIIEKK
jgi:cell division protein DivIC